MAVVAADQRAREGEAARVAPGGVVLDGGTAGVGEAQKLGGLVEGFAEGIVEGGAVTAILSDIGDAESLGMAARDQEHEIGRAQALGQAGVSTWASRWLTISGRPVASAMPLAVISPTMRPPASPGPAVAATPSRSASVSCGLAQGGSGQPVEMADVGAGGDLRHHPAIGAMLGNLRKQLIGQHNSPTVGVTTDDGCGGFVAGGFKTEHGQFAEATAQGPFYHPTTSCSKVEGV